MPNSKVFIIAEAGSNWKVGSYNADLKRAKKLIQIAVQSGADAIKFQVFRASTVYVPNAGNSDYLEKSGIKKSINKIFQKSEMPYGMLPEISDYCKKQNIEFMATAFSVEDAREINKYVKTHKVASYEINHIRLLEYLARTKKPIILSTGASNYDEIDFAVNLLKKHKVKKYALLQCTAKYPAPLESLNLDTIPQMRQKYKVPVGLSDHSTDPVIGPLVAVALGATIIEKHFTLDKNLPGPDHKFALDPLELKKMIQSIRDAQKSFGDGKKRILDVEEELRGFAVRSIQAIKDIKKGDKFVEGYNIDILRPGKRSRGAEARLLPKIIGKTSNKPIKLGNGVRLQDCV
ncbi:MAG: N-acylneuraminate-9-phosphate synthase [Nitrosopumilaceae archaeon]|nr:N-acylneuraminate-9-phosphate synthase [Nitrosopumilaceae archaeon]NDF25543.1 N-acylneuraminate-9-phosphate synthase [Nitrososphaerota archaeon]